MSGPLQAYLRDPGPATFAGVVEAYQGPVLEAAHFILRDMTSAEDATQEVFLALLRRPPRLRSVRNERAFLARCAIRKALDGRKLAMRRRRHETEAIRTRSEAPHDDDETSRVEQLRAAVRRLPEKLGLAVHLHFFQGFAIEDVAAALGCHRNTAARRLERAKRLLRAQLSAGALALLALPGGARILRPGITPSSGFRTRLARLPIEAPAIGAVAAAAAARTIPLTGILWATAGGALLITAIVAIGHALFPSTGTVRESAVTPAAPVTLTHPSESGSAPEPEPEPGAPEPAKAEEVPPGQIRGRVLETADGEPIAGALVSAFAYRQDIPFSPDEEALPEFERTIATDKQGRFVFRDLPLPPPPRAARYFHLKSVAPGWSVASTSLWISQERPGDELILRLAQGKVLRGRAILEDGAPVRQGFVLLARIPPGCAPPDIPLQDHACPRADFERDGTFAFPCGFEDGEYVLEARSPGLRAILVDPFVIEGEDPEEILLTFGQGLRIRGRIVDLSGRPAPDLGVKARTSGRACLSRSLSHWDVPPVSTCSDARGEYVLEGLWPGAYTIEVCGRNRDGRMTHVEARIDGVAPELAQDVEIVVPRLVRIHGRAIGPDGSPVAEEHFEISAYDRDGSSSERTFQSKLRTHADGRYLERMPEGDWRLMALRADGTTTGWLDVDLRESDVEGMPLDLAFAIRATLRVRVLDPENRPISGASVLIDANGGVLNWRNPSTTDMAGMASFHACPPEPHHDTWWLILATSGDLHGRGLWSGAQSAESEMTIVMERDERSPATASKGSAPQGPAIRDESESEAIVAGSATIRGRVVTEGGEPIRFAVVVVLPAQCAPDALVAGGESKKMARIGDPRDRSFIRSALPLESSDGLPSVYTDSKGTFRLEAPAGKDSCLSVWAAGYLRSAGEVEVFQPGGVEERTIVLSSGARVCGQLLYWNGEPAAHVRQNNGTFVTDEEGRFAFGGYRPGQEVYFPLERLPGSPHVLLKLVAGGPERIIRAPREAVIRGRALDPDGLPARGLQIDFDRGERLRRDDLLISDNSVGLAPRILPYGRFEIRGLAPGNRRMIVRAEGAAPKRIDGIDLSEGQEVDLEIRLSAGGTIRCRVADPPPALPGRVSAAFLPASPRQWSDEGMFRQILDLEPDGDFVFPHAAPGTGIFWVILGDLGSIYIESVEVREGEVTDVEAPFRPRGSRPAASE
ncbi:MAG: sigma-70 family RNA polymerase sigma factor [Planctomycetes bacterium]|nr:sigma-70 family RNA polymerase sigma factor [Planctomycetota bacterium]